MASTPYCAPAFGSPRAFIGDYCLFCHDPAIPYVAALRKEFLDDLIRTRPRFIVIYKVCWF